MAETEGILSDYIHLNDLARQLRCSPRTVVRYETLPNGLPALDVAGRRYYKLDEVKEWLERRQRRPNPRRLR